jgi:hypothetical protein
MCHVVSQSFFLWLNVYMKKERIRAFEGAGRSLPFSCWEKQGKYALTRDGLGTLCARSLISLDLSCGNAEQVRFKRLALG